MEGEVCSLDKYLGYIEQKKSGWSHRRLVIASFENSLWIDTARSREFRHWLLLKGFDFQRPSFESVSEKYSVVTSELRKKFPEVVRTTPEEKYVHSTFRSICGCDIHQNFWISNFNADLFIPSVASERFCRDGRDMRGLVIEIDGPVHDRIFKMSKDEHKVKGLSRLGIGLTVIRTTDLNSSHWRRMLEGLAKRRRVPGRTRKNLFRKIYLETLVFHAPYVLSDLFSCDFPLITREATTFFNRTRT